VSGAPKGLPFGCCFLDRIELDIEPELDGRESLSCSDAVLEETENDFLPSMKERNPLVADPIESRDFTLDASPDCLLISLLKVPHDSLFPDEPDAVEVILMLCPGGGGGGTEGGDGERRGESGGGGGILGCGVFGGEAAREAHGVGTCFLLGVRRSGATLGVALKYHTILRSIA